MEDEYDVLAIHSFHIVQHVPIGFVKVDSMVPKKSESPTYPKNESEIFLSNMTYVHRTQIPVIVTLCVFDADHEIFDKFILPVHDR